MSGANAAIVGGFVADAIQTDSLRGGVIGAFSAGVFYGIGSGFQSLAKNSSYAARTLRAGGIMAHGMAGGVMNSLQGGKFGHGSVSAGATQAFGRSIERIDVSTAGFSAQRTLAAAALGGGSVPPELKQAPDYERRVRAILFEPVPSATHELPLGSDTP